MCIVTLQEAQARLSELIAKLAPGEHLQIVEGAVAIARLVREPAHVLQPRRPGSAIGKLHILAEDDEHLRDFHEYMP